MNSLDKYASYTEEQINALSHKESAEILSDVHYALILKKIYEASGMRVADLRRVMKTKDIKGFVYDLFLSMEKHTEVVRAELANK